MKTLFPILFISLFIFSCLDNYREEITDRHDNGSKKTVIKYKGKGSNELIVETIEYFQNGIIKFKKNQDNYIEYHDNGNLKVKYNFKNGKVHGEVIRYFENGKDIEQIYTKNEGKFVGKYKSFWSKDQLGTESNYIDGKLEGTDITYYEHGTVMVKKEYKNGKKHGKYIFYYKNGNKEFEIDYFEDMRHGLFIKYSLDGKIKSKSQYDHDEFVRRLNF